MPLFLFFDILKFLLTLQRTGKTFALEMTNKSTGNSGIQITNINVVSQFLPAGNFVYHFCPIHYFSECFSPIVELAFLFCVLAVCNFLQQHIKFAIFFSSESKTIR